MANAGEVSPMQLAEEQQLANFVLQLADESTAKFVINGVRMHHSPNGQEAVGQCIQALIEKYMGPEDRARVARLLAEAMSMGRMFGALYDQNKMAGGVGLLPPEYVSEAARFNQSSI